MRAKCFFYVTEGGRPRAYVREGQLFEKSHWIVREHRRNFEREARRG
jgi:hypothetical protein